VGELVFAAIAPHGAMVIPEACSAGELSLASRTRSAMAELALRFEQAQPQSTVVLTPHGVHVSKAMAVVTAASLDGQLEDSPNPVRLRCPVDRVLGERILNALEDRGVPAVGVSFGGNDPAESVMPMDWGSLVPLWFMGGRQDPPPPVVAVSPARDLSCEAHLEAGRAISDVIVASSRRVAIIASADHGHAHSSDGPYGFDAAAAAFDRRVVEILEAGELAPVTRIPASLVASARADSWWQMVMLDGALGTKWRARLLSYEAPTYFGMLCADFDPIAAGGAALA
jgi:aromatic ring-opening dioxygenase LigB subunit